MSRFAEEAKVVEKTKVVEDTKAVVYYYLCLGPRRLGHSKFVHSCTQWKYARSVPLYPPPSGAVDARCNTGSDHHDVAE